MDVNMQSKFKGLFKDSVVYGIGGVASRFIGFLLLPIYTRVFNPADYGIMDVIATMIALAGIVLTAGTETALSYYFFQLTDESNRRTTITSTAFYLVLVNGIVALIMWFLAEHISQLVFADQSLASIIRLAVLSVPFSSLLSLNLNILRLLRLPWHYVALTSGNLIFTVSLNIYLVVILEIGVIGVFWTTLLSSLLFALLSSWLNRRFFSLYAINRLRLGQIIRYGAPLVIGGISMWSINFLDRYFLLHFSNLEEIGLYSVGTKLASVIAFVTWAFRLANAPFQFEISLEPEAPQIYSRTLYYYVLLVTFLIAVVAALARPALRILTTESYVLAASVVGLVAFSAGAYGLYQVIGVGLLITKRTGYTSVAIGIGALINVVLLFFLVPPFGMIGAGIAVLMTHIVVIVLLYRAGQRAYFIPYDLCQIGKIVFAGFMVVLFASWIQFTALWIELTVGMGLLAGFLLLLSLSGAMRPSLRTVVQSSLRSVRRVGGSIPHS
jgi:O-antigen/teichoic acid export membrane protein